MIYIIIILTLLLLLIAFSTYLVKLSAYPTTKKYWSTYQTEIDKKRFTEDYYQTLIKEE